MRCGKKKRKVPSADTSSSSSRTRKLELDSEPEWPMALFIAFTLESVTPRTWSVWEPPLTSLVLAAARIKPLGINRADVSLPSWYLFFSISPATRWNALKAVSKVTSASLSTGLLVFFFDGMVAQLEEI